MIFDCEISVYWLRSPLKSHCDCCKTNSYSSKKIWSFIFSHWTAPRPAGVIVIGTNEQRSVFDDNVCHSHIDIKQYYIMGGFTCSFYK